MAKKIQDYKDYIYIAAFTLMLLGYGAKFVLMSDQVKRNKTEVEQVKAEIKQADITLMNYRLEQIEIKLGIIYDYIMEQ